jgi:hypothetical protein
MASQNARLRDNFPIPPELRNHIYSYLLDAKYTRVDRSRVGDRAYKFHTQILGVNRQIHDEAEEYLYKKNVFIVVSHQFSEDNFKTMISAAPCVAELHGVEFKHRLLDVHLSDLPYGHPRQFKIPKSTWLFLSTDLEDYSLFASLFLSDRFRRAPLLILRSGGELVDRFHDSQGRQRSLDHLRLEFYKHRYRKVTCELQGSLLASLRLLDCPSLLVAIRGEVLDPNLTRDLEFSMGTNLACGTAVPWHCLEVWDRIQATVGTSMVENEPTIAAHIYGEILKTVESCRRTRSWRLYDISRALFEMRLFMRYGKVCIQRTMQKSVEFAKAVSDLLELYGQAAGTHRSNPYMLHLHILAVAVAPLEPSLPPFPHLTIAECIARLSIIRHRYQLHDVKILKACADQNKIFTPDDLPAASYSFFAKTFIGKGFGKLIQKPGHIRGFLDFHLLRGLDKGKKEQINKLQAERGWSVTRFDDCGEEDSQSGAA